MPYPITLASAQGFELWAARLGGPGLILIALVDNSFIPLPGSMDVFTILLSSSRHDLWPYYAFMATVGSVIGGYLTYRIGEKGGEEVLEREIGKQRAQKVYAKFGDAGFLSTTVGALLPPPFPIVPVLLAAGVLQYPRKKFMSALGLGRGVRFTIDGLLGVFFGRAIIGFFAQYYKPFLYGLIGLAVVGGIGALIYFKHWKQKKQSRAGQRKENAG